MTTTVEPTTTTADAVEALAGRLFSAAVGAADLYTVHLGARLGLYRGSRSRSSRID